MSAKEETLSFRLQSLIVMIRNIEYNLLQQVLTFRMIADGGTHCY
jgi:hypothetical protein